LELSLSNGALSFFPFPMKMKEKPFSMKIFNQRYYSKPGAGKGEERKKILEDKCSFTPASLLETTAFFLPKFTFKQDHLKFELINALSFNINIQNSAK